MPRVASAFVAYLTFQNFASKSSKVLPLVTYTTWHDMYKLIADIFIFLALIQNIACQYLVRRKSAYFGIELDRVSRVFFPALFYFAQLLLYPAPHTTITSLHGTFL